MYNCFTSLDLKESINFHSIWDKRTQGKGCASDGLFSWGLLCNHIQLRCPFCDGLLLSPTFKVNFLLCFSLSFYPQSFPFSSSCLQMWHGLCGEGTQQLLSFSCFVSCFGILQMELGCCQVPGNSNLGILRKVDENHDPCTFNQSKWISKQLLWLLEPLWTNNPVMGIRYQSSLYLIVKGLAPVWIANTLDGDSLNEHYCFFKWLLSYHNVTKILQHQFS